MDERVALPWLLGANRENDEYCKDEDGCSMSTLQSSVQHHMPSNAINWSSCLRIHQL